VKARDFRGDWYRAEDAVGDAWVWCGNRDLCLPATIALVVFGFALGAVLF
jgi:hypothetical protein